MVLQILSWFGLQFSTTQPTPLAVHQRLTGPFHDEPFESSGPYTDLVGACAASLVACVVTSPSAPPAEASFSFTLESRASQCFFCNHTSLTPLSFLFPFALADPASEPVIARSSTNLQCTAVPSGVLSGLHIPSFSRNLVGVGYLQDCRITATFLGHGRTAIYTVASIGALLDTFTEEHGSGLYVLHTAYPHVAATGQVVLFTASQRLISFLPHVFASLPLSHVPSCTPCIKGRLLATPHSSSLPPATAPFQTLHLDTSDVTSTLIRQLLATETTRGRRVSCLHSDHGFEFRYGILAGFCAEPLASCLTARGFTNYSLDLVPWCCVGVSCRGLHWACPRHLCGQALGSRPPYVFLGFLVGSCVYTFYHLPLHRFLDSRDVIFDDSVSYYTRFQHYRDKLKLTLGVLEQRVLTLEVLVLRVLELRMLALEVLKSGGARAEGAGTGGASFGGARSWDTSSGGAGAGGVRFEEAGA
ncbi:unnamed protein product [Closterium sp. NIES-53]